VVHHRLLPPARRARGGARRRRPAAARRGGRRGPGAVLPDVAERLADPARRERLLAAIRRVEAEPSLLGASSHLLAVAHR
jgi:hypothetical protein